jgi:hypothetical protein
MPPTFNFPFATVEGTGSVSMPTPDAVSFFPYNMYTSYIDTDDLDTECGSISASGHLVRHHGRLRARKHAYARRCKSFTVRESSLQQSY